MTPGPRLVGPRKLPCRQGTAEWLEARRYHITATDMAAIEGASPWRCEQDVADEKLNGYGVESTLVMRVGNALEDLIAGAYAEQTERKVRRVRRLWESATIPWAAASPDATAAGRLVELKWTGNRSRFRDGLPEDIEIQARWQALVADVPEVDVATLTVGDDKVRIFTVGRDAGIEHYLVGKAEDFRARLAAGGPFAQSLDSIKRRHPADDGTEIIADPDLDGAVRALRDVRDGIDSLKANEERLKVAIQTRMADAAYLVGDGYRVTWKRTRDVTETDWKSLATSLLAQLPEPDRAAVVGLHSTARSGPRPFRVTWGKGETE